MSDTNEFMVNGLIDWNASNGTKEFIFGEHVENAIRSDTTSTDDEDVCDSSKMKIRVVFQVQWMCLILIHVVC